MAGWTLAFAFGGNQRIGNGWSAVWSQTGADVTAGSVDHNRNLASGATTSIGFTATYSGDNPAPPAFTLNGNPCAVV